MRSLILLAVVVGTLLAPVIAHAGDADQKRRSPAFDTKKRVAWTGSKVQGSPDPPAPYRTQQVFPKLKFYEPLAMTWATGTNRFLVAERHARVYSFENKPDVEKPELFLSLRKTPEDESVSLYGLAVHPKFHENGYVYVTYIPEGPDPLPRGSRLSRFQVSRDNPWKCDPKTETVILEWPSGGHNAGCLAFGPDGYLYLSCGDGSGIADELQTGQDVTDLLACMLRIDVDHPDPGKNYGIPKTNPFVLKPVPGARPEIWAYGLRQIWKFSFDRATGDLWAGEVGQDLWESVYRITAGGNYGWSVNEGSHPFRPERKTGPTPILKPVVEHPHSDFRSLTGGFVYHGKRLKELIGAYIYGDYDTGKIAALRVDSKTYKATWQQELVDTPLRIITFAEDNSNELYIVDFINGGIHQLVPAPKGEPTAPFPKKLSQTGLFASTRDHVPAPGLIPYSVNAELWSDHAIKERFLALPGTGQIEFDTVEYPQPAPGAPRGWRFPDGTVVVKTFVMEMEQGNPASRKRLETRLLHFEQLAGTEEVGDQVWRGYTYVWNDDQTDAELLDAKGLDWELTIRDSRSPGGVRKQTWHFPSRSECTLCHTMPAKYVLGVNTLQMNREYDYGNGVVSNQLATLAQLAVFKDELPHEPADLPHLADYRDESQGLNERARSYLHSNCAHCHMKWGGGNAEFQLLSTLPLGELGIIKVRPNHGAFDLKNPSVLEPGSPERSMILHRMTMLGLGRMPHVASNVVDEQSAKLLREWIAKLPQESR